MDLWNCGSAVGNAPRALERSRFREREPVAVHILRFHLRISDTDVPAAAVDCGCNSCAWGTAGPALSRDATRLLRSGHNVGRFWTEVRTVVSSIRRLFFLCLDPRVVNALREVAWSSRCRPRAV